MRLTVGMACYNDFAGVRYTVQALRLYHDMRQVELIVADNCPNSSDGESVKQFLEKVSRCGDVGVVRYLPAWEVVGTSYPRSRIFEEADSDAVLCIDSHVMLWPGSLDLLADYYRDHPHTKDLLSGPLRYEDGSPPATHFADIWRCGMWGVFANDAVGMNSGRPFEIPAMGLGLFSQRKEAFLGFPERVTEFGGEEWCYHEKVRKAGARCLCLPGLGWDHRFGDGRSPKGCWTKVRNYVIWLTELGIPPDRCRAHFVDGVNEDGSGWTAQDRHVNTITAAQWDTLTADPWNPPIQDPGHPSFVMSGGGPTSSQEWFDSIKQVGHDFSGHEDTLRKLASVEKVVELGGRRGSSTVCLLAGKPNRLIVVDPVIGREALALVEIGKRQGTDVRFVAARSETAQGMEADMLLIDTEHHADQLYSELLRHAPYVRGHIVLHDTVLHEVNGEGGKPGMSLALQKFTSEHREWFVMENDRRGYGLMVLSRLPSDRPPVPIFPWPPGFGPGTELKKLLKSLEVSEKTGCDCNARAEQMDRWGIAGCREHKDEIVGWMKAGMDRWGWREKLNAAKNAVLNGVAFKLNPLDPFPGIVEEAIRRAEGGE